MIMRKRIALLLILVAVSLADGRLAPRTPVRASKYVQVIPRVEIISAIPRNETGRFGVSDIALLDNGEAWAVGYDSKHPQQAYHSRDRGASWEPINVPGDDWLTFKALSFPDSKHGWAVGGYGLIVRTTDAGRSWQRMNRPTNHDLEAVCFVNSCLGFAGGTKAVLDRITEEVKGSVEILRTKDGGETWQRCYSDSEPISVFQITPFSDSGAFVILGGNRLIRTDDQGASWRLVDLSGKHVSSLAIAGDGVYWVVGQHGTFEHSDNGGRDWQHVTSLPGLTSGRNWCGIAFNSAGVGVAVGDAALLAVTLDNGKTWQLPDLNIRDDLRAVRLQGNDAVVLGAKSLYSIRVSGITQ